MTQDSVKTELDAALLDATAETAMDALTRAGGSAGALIEAWVKRGNAAAVAAAAERAEGGLRKAARRGVAVLRSRGVVIPERARTATLSAARPETVTEAWMMPPDTAGNTLLVVASHAGASRYTAAFVVLNDALGVHRVDVGEMSLSQLRTNLARSLPGAQYKPVKVPVDWVRHRVAAARKLHAQRGVPEPLGFSSARALLEPVPDAAPSHPFDDEGLELSPEDAKELGLPSAALHSLPEFRGWFPARSAVQEMLFKVGETLTPGEEPDPEKVKAALEAEVIAATDRYFTPERRADLVRAMKDSALSVLAREGEQKALEVAATIACIETRGILTDAPHEVGFLKGFFDKAVGLMVAQGGGRLTLPVPARAQPSG